MPGCLHPNMVKGWLQLRGGPVKGWQQLRGGLIFTGQGVLQWPNPTGQGVDAVERWPDQFLYV